MTVENRDALKKKIQQLEGSELRYRSLVEQAAEGILVADLETRKFIYANSAMCKMLGYSREEIEKLSVASIHPAEKLQYIIGEFEAQGRGEKTLTTDIPCLKKDGKVFYADIKTSSMVIDDRICNIGFFTDTTERIKADKIKLSHLVLLESMEKIDAVIRFEMDMDRMLWNAMEAVLKIFDCDRAWLLFPCDPDSPSFRVPVEVTRPEYPGAKELNLDVPMAPGHKLDMEEALKSVNPVVCSAGSSRPVSQETQEQFGVQAQMFSVIYPRVGKPWLLGLHQCSYSREWTDAEQKLFKEVGRRIADGLSIVLFVDDLQDSEERFRATFEQVAVGIAHVSLDGRWRRVNQKLCDIMGYLKEEMLRKTVHEMTFSDDRGSDRENLRQLLTGEISTYSSEKRFVRKDMTPTWINLTVSCVHDASGKPSYFIYVLEDITPRKKSEEERQKLQDRLLYTQKMESIAGLAAGMAHEINNPLAGILQSVQTLDNRLFTSLPANLEAAEQMGVGLEDVTGYMELRKIKKLTGIIKSSGLKASAIVKNMLDYARKDPEKKIENSMGYLLDETIKLCQNDYELKKRYNFKEIQIIREFDPDTPPVLCESGKIQQVFLNILKNGVEAFSEKEFDLEHPTFTLRVYPSPDRVCVEIEDNGPGMEGETLKRICEPFFTTKAVGAGTGLGLYVSYLIVTETHEGELIVESQPGKWTRFIIRLPVSM